MGESVAKPLLYYKNNVTGTLNLIEVMHQHKVKNFVFSSSATVYGNPKTLPIVETAKRSCTNPYGQFKLTVEYILEDLAKSESSWNIVSLRYFNPVSAHKSGQSGENPNNIPNNLMPCISQVAAGKLDKLSIFGNDYDIIDGTGMRDFIHIVDLAKSHVAALNYLNNHQSIGFLPINLGTGEGISVLELVHAFIEYTAVDVLYQFLDRRLRGIGSCYVSADRASELLNCQNNLNIGDMCKDTWQWRSINPEGYKIRDLL